MLGGCDVGVAFPSITLRRIAVLPSQPLPGPFTNGPYEFRFPPFDGRVCMSTGGGFVFAPPPAPFQGRRVAFALRLSQEVGSWGRMYCLGP